MTAKLVSELSHLFEKAKFRCQQKHEKVFQTTRPGAYFTSSYCCSQENEVLLKESLRAEAGARRSRLRQRVAGRAAERSRELKAEGRSESEVAAEEAAIRAAAEAEENKLEAVRVATLPCGFRGRGRGGNTPFESVQFWVLPSV